MKSRALLTRLAATLWLCGFAAPSAFALDPQRALTQYVLSVWRMEEGLPHNSVRAISASRQDTVQRVLVEGQARMATDELMGRTECNRVVTFAGQDRLIGQMVDVRIALASQRSLRGEVLVRESASV